MVEVTTQEQIKYMELGLESLTYAMTKDKAMFPAQRIRIEEHARSHIEVIESLCRLRDLEK